MGSQKGVVQTMQNIEQYEFSQKDANMGSLGCHVIIPINKEQRMNTHTTRNVTGLL